MIRWGRAAACSCTVCMTAKSVTGRGDFIWRSVAKVSAIDYYSLTTGMCITGNSSGQSTTTFIIAIFLSSAFSFVLDEIHANPSIPTLHKLRHPSMPSTASMVHFSHFYPYLRPLVLSMHNFDPSHFSYATRVLNSSIASEWFDVS